MGLLSRIAGAFQTSPASPTAASAPNPNPNPDEELLGEIMVRVAEDTRIVQVSRHPDELAFIARGTSGSDLTGYLTNLRLEIRGASPEHREMLVARYVASMHATLDEPATLEQLRSSLRLVLRRGDLATLAFTPENLSICWETLPFLVESLAQDTPTSIAMMRAKSIGRFDLSVDEARRIANENMRALPVTIDSYDPDATAPLFMIADGDDYEAARLLVPDWLAELRGKVPGNPLVVAPTRSLVVIGGDGDEATIERLLRLAKAEYEASPRNISLVPYVYHEDGVLRPLELPASHASAHHLTLAKYALAAHSYGEQQAQLQKHYDDAAIERFAASCSVVEKDEVLSSYCVWSRGVVTSLPIVDAVALRDDSVEPARVIRVPMVVVRKLCAAHLAVEANVVPERLVTNGFPDATLWKTLAAHAI